MNGRLRLIKGTLTRSGKQTFSSLLPFLKVAVGRVDKSDLLRYFLKLHLFYTSLRQDFGFCKI